jgi:hypothetical protein
MLDFIQRNLQMKLGTLKAQQAKARAQAQPVEADPLAFLQAEKGVQRKTIAIPSFGGINYLPNRSAGQASWGRNFYTKNGSLFTRGGYSTITAPDLPDGPFPIISLHSAGAGKVTTRLLAQVDGFLYRLLSDVGVFTEIESAVGSGKMYSGCWTSYASVDDTAPTTYLLLGNGTKMYAYAIAGDRLETIVQDVTGTGSLPQMGNFIAYGGPAGGFAFGWWPNGSTPNVINFNGYDDETPQQISKDYWPPDFVITLNVPGTEPVLDCFAIGGYMLILTPHTYTMLQGINEDNFEWDTYGGTGELQMGVSALVGDSVFYLGSDLRVYETAGSGPAPVSEPIDYYLRQENFNGAYPAFALGINGQYHLFVPNATTTRDYVYDTDEGEWYVNEYAFIATCGCIHGDYLQTQYIHLGTADGQIVKLDDSADDNGTAIETQLVLGPFPDTVRSRVTTLRLVSQPSAAFTVNAYCKTDEYAETSPAYFDFVADGTTQTVKQYLPGQIGYNSQIRLGTTDSVNLMQGLITVVPREAK